MNRDPISIAVDDLRDCPFCGTHDFATGWVGDELYWVTCACGASMGEPGEKPERDISDSWNARSPDPALGGATHELA